MNEEPVFGHIVDQYVGKFPVEVTRAEVAVGVEPE